MEYQIFSNISFLALVVWFESLLNNSIFQFATNHSRINIQTRRAAYHRLLSYFNQLSLKLM